MILKIEVKTLLFTGRGKEAIGTANPLCLWLKPRAHSKLLKDYSNPLVLGTKTSWCNSKWKLVDKVIKLFYACSASTCVVLILLLLLYPVILSFIRSKSPKFEIYCHSVIALGLSFYISIILLLLSLILPINMTVTILP